MSDSLRPHESQHLILCRPLLLLPPIPPSIRVFSNESTLLIRWQKYWSFSLSINPSNEYSQLIPIRIDWFDLLEVQGTLKSLGRGVAHRLESISIQKILNQHNIVQQLTSN